MFQVSRAPAPHDGADHSRKKLSHRCGRIGGRRRLRQLKPRLSIGAPCPKVSLGPSRPSFISEASYLEALLKVRIRPLPPSGAASSTHRFAHCRFPVGRGMCVRTRVRRISTTGKGYVCPPDDRVPEFQVIRLCVSGKSGPRPPRRGGSFEKETFSSLWQNRRKATAPAAKPRLSIGAPCPKVSLGPSRPSFISEASLEALLKVRIRTTRQLGPEPLLPDTTFRHRPASLSGRGMLCPLGSVVTPEYQ